MQGYSNPASRNPQAATNGTLPNKVSVPLPGTNATQKPENGGVKSTPAGFNSGLINGKI
jgi:hypothetical protein